MTELHVEKLIAKMQQLIITLERNQDLRIHQHIDQFYYMQKKEELVTLLSRLVETSIKLQQLTLLMKENYGQAFCAWKKDCRRVNRFLHSVPD